MSVSRKYGANGKTFHVPWSEGTDSTDRKNWDYWQDIQKVKELVFTEKLDGQGSCLNEFGVFARSHAAPSNKPWDDYLKVKHGQILHDLRSDSLEVFGESMYAIHSIEYPRLDEHFYVFAMRRHDKWLGWEEIKWLASLFDMRTVPVISNKQVSTLTEASLTEYVKGLTKTPSTFGSYDVVGGQPCTMEGVVFRNVEEYHVDNFVQNVFKIVRKGHVKTDEHWERHWKRAFLKHELEAYAEKNSIVLSGDEDYMKVIRTLRPARV